MGLTCSRIDGVAQSDVAHESNHAVAGSSGQDMGGGFATAGGKIKKKNKRSEPGLLDPYMHALMKSSFQYACNTVEENDEENEDDDDIDAPDCICDDEIELQYEDRYQVFGEKNPESGKNKKKAKTKNVQSTESIPSGVVNSDVSTWSGQYHLLYNSRHQQQNQNTSGTSSGRSSSPSKGVLLGLVSSPETLVHHPTRLVVRRRNVRNNEEGLSGTHLYCLRYPRTRALQRELHTSKLRVSEEDGSDNALSPSREQYPESALARNMVRKQQTQKKKKIKVPYTDQPRIVLPQEWRTNNFGSDTCGTSMRNSSACDSSRLSLDNHGSNMDTASNVIKTNKSTFPSQQSPPSSATETVDQLFQRSALTKEPKYKISDWVTVSEEHSIYVADLGISPADCDRLVHITEQSCRGQYAAYTYAKQTLGCREYPTVARSCQNLVHTIVHAIYELGGDSTDKKMLDDVNDAVDSVNNKQLTLDDREPHMVKYDVTRKERQKLDMHTDKSEWTFLMALSNGCGLDYDGGGTYFECMDATVHIQRGHALVFPGKLRHCGQRITTGLRFLLVGFLVDKNSSANNNTGQPTSKSANSISANDKLLSCQNNCSDERLDALSVAGEPGENLS